MRGEWGLVGVSGVGGWVVVLMTSSDGRSSECVMSRGYGGVWGIRG